MIEGKDISHYSDLTLLFTLMSLTQGMCDQPMILGF